MKDAGSLPYWRLSSFYFFYFSALGALVPYWSLYLHSLGFGPVQIGQLMAILMATKILAPNVWGWLADQRGQRMDLVRKTSLISALAFAGVYLEGGFWWLAAVMAIFSFFWNAALPQFEVVTLTHLGEQTHRYTHIRLWGSVGFILAVIAVGYLLDTFQVGLIPHVVLSLMAGIWLASLLIEERAAGNTRLFQEPLLRVLRRPTVLALLAACFLMQASHGAYYSFYSIYLEDNGYRTGLIGQLWAIGVLAEVVLFTVMHQLLERFGMRQLFLASFVLTSLRWTMVGLFPGNLPVQLTAQLLHAASYGMYHAVAIQFVHRYFTGRNQGRGQALYSSMSFGAGGAAGSLVSGYLWEGVGAEHTYLIAAMMSSLAFLISWRRIPGEPGEAWLLRSSGRH